MPTPRITVFFYIFSVWFICSCDIDDDDYLCFTFFSIALFTHENVLGRCVGRECSLFVPQFIDNFLSYRSLRTIENIHICESVHSRRVRQNRWNNRNNMCFLNTHDNAHIWILLPFYRSAKEMYTISVAFSSFQFYLVLGWRCLFLRPLDNNAQVIYLNRILFPWFTSNLGNFISWLISHFELN